MGFLDRLLGRNKDSPNDAFRALRTQFLSASRDGLNFGAADGTDGLRAALMDWNLDGSIVSVVAIADGTVSMYLSSGGGVIGAGAHEAPRQAAGTFLRIAAEQRAQLHPAREAPLPQEGMTSFFVRTTTGDLAGGASTNELGEGRHALSPLFHAAQNVITAIRMLPSNPR